MAFWSLKPVFISIISDRGGFAEVYLTAGIISVMASAVGMLVLWRRTGTVVQGGRESLSGVAAAATSGTFLALVLRFLPRPLRRFAINATRSFDRLVGSRTIAIFYAVSVANAIAFIAVFLALRVTGHTLRFSAFDSHVLLMCALIGIGTYLVAEISWA